MSIERVEFIGLLVYITTEEWSKKNIICRALCPLEFDLLVFPGRTYGEVAAIIGRIEIRSDRSSLEKLLQDSRISREFEKISKLQTEILNELLSDILNREITATKLNHSVATIHECEKIFYCKKENMWETCGSIGNEYI